LGEIDDVLYSMDFRYRCGRELTFRVRIAHNRTVFA
jgi:hypothetical protein